MILGAVRVGATLCRVSNSVSGFLTSNGTVSIWSSSIVLLLSVLRIHMLRPLVNISSFVFISHVCEELRRSDLASESRSSS
jgi:hypothetical protein